MTLRSGAFDVDDLVHVYAPPNLRSVMPGNKVMLRSGGPELTVISSTEDNAIVNYIDDDGKLVKLEFPLVCLTCYGAK